MLEGLTSNYMNNFLSNMASGSMNNSLQSMLANNVGSLATDTLASTAGDGMLQGIMDSVGSEALTNNIPNFMNSALITPGGSSGILSQLSGLLGNEKLMGGLKAGGNLYSAYNQNKQANKASDLMDRNMKMAEDAYARDVEADENRQKLVF